MSTSDLGWIRVLVSIKECKHTFTLFIRETSKGPLSSSFYNKWKCRTSWLKGPEEVDIVGKQ